MIVSIKLQPEMQCEYICHRIHEAVTKYQKENPDLSNSLLVIDIKKTHDDDSYIPKLEYKNSPP